MALDHAVDRLRLPPLRVAAAPPPAPAVTVPDARAPVARVAARKLQKLGRNVRVSVSCPEEACVVSASGAVSVPKIGGAQARRFKLKKLSTAITKGATARLGPKLSYAARRSIRRALARGRRITVKLTVTATDAAGNSRTLTRYVRLKR
ncbi:MAG: hypothetical protein KY433_10120 [Actinobacteria bacterium]|nr:hypothetical protein [Actinomycetota bacterium]